MYIVCRGVLRYVEIHGSCIVYMVLGNDGHDIALVAALAERVFVRVTSRTEVRGVTLFHLFQSRVRCTVLETDDTMGELGRTDLCLGTDSIVEILGEEPVRYIIIKLQNLLKELINELECNFIQLSKFL